MIKNGPSEQWGYANKIGPKKRPKELLAPPNAHLKQTNPYYDAIIICCLGHGIAGHPAEYLQLFQSYKDL